MKYRLSEGILEGVLDSGSKYDKIKEVGYERAERLDRVIVGLQDSIKVVQAIVDSEDPDEPSEAKDSLAQLKDDLKTMQDAKDRLEDEIADVAEQEKRERERVGGENSIYSDADDMRTADEDEDGLDADSKSKGGASSEKSFSSDKNKEGEDGDDANGDKEDGKGKQGHKGDKDGKDSDSGEAGTEEGEGEDEEGEGKEGEGEGKEDDSENGKSVKSGASKHSGNGPSEADSSDGNETDGTDGNQSNTGDSKGKKSGQKSDGSDGADGTDGEDGEDGELEDDTGNQSGKKGSKNKQSGKGSNGDDSEGDGDEEGEDGGEPDGDDTDGEQSGKKSGKNGKQSKSGKPGDDSDGEESDGDQDGDEIGDNDKTGEKSGQKGQKGQKDKGSSDGDSNDSDDDNDADEDDENGDDNNGGGSGSGSKGKKSKAKNSDDDDDDDDNQSSQEGDNDRDDDEEEEDEDEDVDLLAPPPPKSRSRSSSSQQQKAVRNPFGNPYDNDQDGGGGGGGTPPDVRDPKLSELIKALSQLTGDAKQGAFDGLSKILADREAKAKGQKVGEGLSEALGDTDSIIDMTPEAFSRMINTALGHAIKAKGVIKTTPLAQRIEMSKDLDLNPKKVWQELEKEMKVNQVVDPIYSDPDEIDRIKKRRKANSRNFGSFARFQETLRQVILDQVRPKTVHRSTWQMPDRRLIPGSGVVKKGTALRRERLDDIPILQVYVDQSASWDAEDRKLASSILTEFAELQDRRELDLQTYYFADHVHTDPWAARAERSTGAWSDILDNIANTKANNVVIMTDSDLANQTEDSTNHRVKIDGGVWFLYKGSPENYEYKAGKAMWLPDHLQGRMFNGEFKIGNAGQKTN